MQDKRKSGNEVIPSARACVREHIQYMHIMYKLMYLFTVMFYVVCDHTCCVWVGDQI
jgi:hypothetical protein